MARSSSSLRARDRYGRFKKSPVRSRSKSRARSYTKKRRSEAAKKGWKTRRRTKKRRSEAAKKGWKTRRRQQSKSRSKSRSRSYTKKRRSEAAKKGWKTRRRQQSKSRSKSRSKSKSRAGLTAKEEKTLARRLGITVEQLRSWTKAASRRRLSESIAKKEKQRRASYRRYKSRKQDPSLARVLKHFYEVLPEELRCRKSQCRPLYEKHRKIGILPKSVADLELIFSNASEREDLNARCWICLYRAYRDLYYRLNKEYPGPDVSDDFADQFSVSVVSVESGPALSPDMAKSEIAYLKRAQKKLRAICKALLSVDPRTGESEFDQDEELEKAKSLLRELRVKYPDVVAGLPSGTTTGALRQSCELLESRIRRYLTEIGRGQSFSVASVEASEDEPTFGSMESFESSEVPSFESLPQSEEVKIMEFPSAADGPESSFGLEDPFASYSSDEDDFEF